MIKDISTFKTPSIVSDQSLFLVDVLPLSDVRPYGWLCTILVTDTVLLIGFLLLRVRQLVLYFRFNLREKQTFSLKVNINFTENIYKVTRKCSF